MQLVSLEEVIDGVRPNLPNAVVISSDGSMYWTDSDANYKLHDGIYTLFVDGTGRLINIFILYFNNLYVMILRTKGYYVLFEWLDKLLEKCSIINLKLS